MSNPKWKVIVSQVGAEVFTRTAREFEARLDASANLDAGIAAQLALYHLDGCLNASIHASAKLLPSVAICLLRQCVEALAVIDAGFQEPLLRDDLLADWLSGKRSCGELRKALEAKAWHRYGLGLWSESWAEFFRNLASAVQPYAHYTPSLFEWQRSVVHSDGVNRSGKLQMIFSTGPICQDPVKLSRIALLQSLVVWTLGRLLLSNATNPQPAGLNEAIAQLGRAIGGSKLLFRSKDWADEMMPHLIFRPDVDWRDA
ncbi:MAG: hypothetical protein ACE15C_06050 [Phycisphaerae bacterium]